MKKTIMAFADVGSHGGIYQFESGPVAERYPYLMQIYSEQVTRYLIPVTITYEFPVKTKKGNQMSEKIATNLVGRSAQITMGCEVTDAMRALYQEAPAGGAGKYFGENVEIVAVYKDEGALMATVRIHGYADSKPTGGKLIECHVTHLRLRD